MLNVMKNENYYAEKAYNNELIGELEWAKKGDTEGLWENGILMRLKRNLPPSTDGVYDSECYEERPLFIGSTMGSRYNNPSIIKAADYRTYIEATKETDALIRDDGSALFNYGWIYKLIKTIQGDLLTILDASLDESQKTRATKDLIRKAFQSRIEEVADCAYFTEAPDINKATQNFIRDYREWKRELDSLNEIED